MTNPTSNFGWQMPTPTDLVTDLPADFEVFGQAVDTTMADLKGGTSGQILSKASNTDMDFTWITNDVGDITAVTVSSPLTGGGTSGSVSVGILSGTTSNLGAVQLSDSTSSTSTTLAATANAVKTSYDLANTANTTATAAIPKSTVTTAGDIIFRNGSAPTRLGIGTAGQVLTVNSGATAPEWAAAASGKVKQVVSVNYTTPATTTSTTFVDTGLTLNITPTSASSTILALFNNGWSHDNASTNAGVQFRLLRTATQISISPILGYTGGAQFQSGMWAGNVVDSPATTSTITYKAQFNTFSAASVATAQYFNSTSTLTLIEIGA